MKRLFCVIVLICATLMSCLGQASYSVQFTTIKNLVEENNEYFLFNSRSFRTQGKFVETYNEEKLVFSIEDQEYVMPVQLAKKDLGAVNRFRSLNLQKGDSIVVEGRVKSIEINGEYYNGLVEARIIGDKEVNFFQDVEVKPSFKGGDANEFSKWVNTQLKYPEIAKENGIQGRVTVQFIIKADGSVTNIRVIRGIDEALDKEAVRVVSLSPKWEPGRSNDKPVDVVLTFPVIFQLN